MGKVSFVQGVVEVLCVHKYCRKTVLKTLCDVCHSIYVLFVPAVMLQPMEQKYVVVDGQLHEKSGHCLPRSTHMSVEHSSFRDIQFHGPLRLNRDFDFLFVPYKERKKEIL